jgi:preprotein translocase subunit YajC
MLTSSFVLAQAPAGQANPIVAFLPLVLMFVVFYFLLILPQQKRQKELNQMIQNLKKGDRVVTSGGVIGTIAGLQDDYVVLKVGDTETKIEVLKSAITGKRS